MNDQAKLPAEFDLKQTHVTAEWKYTSPLIWCRFDPTGRYVFSSAEDNQVQRWEFESGKVVNLEGHESWVRDFVFSSDGKVIATVGCDEKMIFWTADTPAPERIRDVKAHQGWIRCADTNSDGTMIATGGNDHLVKVWDMSSGELLQTLAGHQSHVYSVYFHPTQPVLLSGDLDGKVKQWSIETGEAITTFDAKDLHTYNTGQQVHYGGVRSLSLSPDGTQLACSGLHKATNPLGAINEPLIVVFDWKDQKQLRTHVSDGVRGVLWRMFHLADGSLMGASGGSGGGFLLFWNADEEKSVHKFKLKDTIRGMDLHPDNLHVATTHWDRHLRISRMTKKAT